MHTYQGLLSFAINLSNLQGGLSLPVEVYNPIYVAISSANKWTGNCMYTVYPLLSRSDPSISFGCTLSRSQEI